MSLSKPSSACTTEASSKKKATKIKLPDEEIYDFARKEGPNEKDPRFLGGPCQGQHSSAPMGRGSKSGKNGWALWRTCQTCGLRLEYIPAFGATGKHRSAGPLGADVKDQLKEKHNELASSSKDVLENHTIALDGAERSLVRRLEAIRQQKETKGYKAAISPTMEKKTTVETKKAVKREGEQKPEELEAKEESADSWSPLTD